MAQVQVRPARPADLDELAAFESATARRRFGVHAVTDQARHRARLAKALGRADSGMVVAVDARGRVAGWLWLAVNTNFLTGTRYVTCRSLAVDDSEGGVGEAAREVTDRLIAYAVDYARRHGLREITGQVTPDEESLRQGLIAAGFEPTHLTMSVAVPAQPTAAEAGSG